MGFGVNTKWLTPGFRCFFGWVGWSNVLSTMQLRSAIPYVLFLLLGEQKGRMEWGVFNSWFMR